MTPCRGQSDSVSHPATCDLVSLSGICNAAGGKDRIRPVESLQEKVDWNAQFWPADGFDGVIFVTTEGYNGLQPPPYEVLKPFLMDYLLHLHLLFCLFFFPFHFIIVFCCFSFWFPRDLYLFSPLAFLFWCGLDCACFVFEVTSSVSPKLSLRPLPVLSFDLMVFVFLLRVYCYSMSRV